MNNFTHAYIGIKDGECLAATVDQGNKQTADDVAKFIKEGCTIERVPIDVARESLFERWPRCVEVEGRTELGDE